MVVRFLSVLILLCLPSATYAATLQADDSLRVSTPVASNAYLAGMEVEVRAPVAGDVLALGSLVRLLAPIDGDILSAAGTFVLSAPSNEDVRVIAAQILADEAITGEFAALGGLVRLTEPAGEVRVVGATVEILGGAGGPVSVYANKVTLGGEFLGDVHVVAADTIVLEEGTVIRGNLEYNAPQQASIPDTVAVGGEVRYVGSASFLPTEAEAKAFALAGVGVYVVVRLVGGMLAAGLLAGLFPRFTATLSREVLEKRSRHTFLMFLIGFSVLVGVPFALILLALSVVGLGVAALLASAYLFLLALAYVTAAVLLGTILSRLFFKTRTPDWRDALVGGFALYILGLVPVFGFLGTLILTSLTLGTSVYLFVRFAFPKSHDA